MIQLRINHGDGSKPNRRKRGCVPVLLSEPAPLANNSPPFFWVINQVLRQNSLPLHQQLVARLLHYHLFGFSFSEVLKQRRL